jgi:hypothetical protein
MRALTDTPPQANHFGSSPTGIARFGRIAASILLALALLGAGMRAAIVTSRSEVGWESIRLQWSDALVGWLGWKHEPIDTQEPLDQATFWLAEVERIHEAEMETAELCMGSAWVLDSPGVRFMQNYFKQQDAASMLPPGFGVTLDQDAIQAAKSEFETKCRDRCLALAERATELNPTDVRWWRMRALLQQHPETHAPRHDGWLTVLDECSRHDPDNALYDYMAALYFWNEGAEYDWPIDDPNWPEDELRLIIKDADLFQRGIDRFEQGQKKGYLAVGEAGLPAVAHVLDASRIPKIDQAEVGVNRSLSLRQSILFYGIWRWQGVRGDNAEQSADMTGKLKTQRQQLHLFNQTVVPSETSAQHTLVTFDSIRDQTIDELTRTARGHPELIPSHEFDAIIAKEREIRVQARALKQVLTQQNEERTKQRGRFVVPAMVVAVSLVSAASLFLVAGASGIVVSLLRRRRAELQRLGWLRHLLAWMLGCGGTFVVLGMAPAEIISHDVQKWTIVGLVWCVMLAIAGLTVWQLWRFMKRRRFQFGLLSLFVVTFGVAVLSSLWPLMRAVLTQLNEHPPELWLHARGWKGIDGEALRVAASIDKGTWFWAVIQWFNHSGVYAGLWVSLVASAVWFALRCARLSQHRFLDYWTRDVRARWGSLLACVRSSALIAGLSWLLLYLMVVPTVTQGLESEYQYKMAYCRNPVGFHAAQSPDALSQAEMRHIRKTVEDELRSSGP